jgi:hypothetical protein
MIGAPGDADPPPLPVRVTAWYPINKGVIVGSVDLVLGESLEIFGCWVVRSNDSIWVAFPGEPRFGPDEKLVRDAHGKKQYNTILKWNDRASSDRFQHAVLGAIAAEFGDDALNGGDSPGARVFKVTHPEGGRA